MDKIKYYYSLDGIRALAAFAVVLTHFFTVENTRGYEYILKITQLGSSGVSLFFVLSGFVITRILLNSRKSENYFQTFYLRRLFRIFPLYYFALACYYFVPILLNENYQFPKFSDQIYYWLYLQNFARTLGWSSSGPEHYWSLAVEEHFYLLWPAIIYFVYRSKHNVLLFVSGILIVLPGILRLYMLINDYEINAFTLTRLDQLAMGCVMAMLERNGYLTKSYFNIYLGLFIIGCIFVFGVSRLDYISLNVFKHYAFGICYFGLIAVSAIGSSQMFFNKIMNFNIIQYLGKISYGIYVWHILIISIISKHTTNNVLIDLLLVIVVTIFISTLSFYILEKPFLRLKKYTKY